MKLGHRLLGIQPARTSERALNSLEQIYGTFAAGGNIYALNQTYPQGKNEGPPNNYRGYAELASNNGVFFACLLVRMSLFSEARFLFRNFRGGRPGDLFGNQDLRILERPDRNLTTGGLITRMEQDSSLAGNAYNARVGDRVIRLRPDWVTIVMGSPNGYTDDPADDPEIEVIGYLFAKPGAPDTARVFLPEQVSHFAPIPDPLASFRGMSWMTPVLRELDADDQATNFKAQFFRNGATPNMVVTLDSKINPEAFEKFKRIMEQEHTGWSNAFKTLYLGGGADAKIVGNNFEQMSFKSVQAAGETRIAAASGVPPVIVGLSEGLGAATYSNYSQARRRLADGTARPWWREAAASLETIVKTPADAQLWYDDRDIAFLRDDAKDLAEVQQMQSQSARTLVDAGWKPDDVVKAISANDMGLLAGNHTGLTSAQLLPPQEAIDATGNGAQQVKANGTKPVPAALTP